MSEWVRSNWFSRVNKPYIYPKNSRLLLYVPHASIRNHHPHESCQAKVKIPTVDKQQLRTNPTHDAYMTIWAWHNCKFCIPVLTLPCLLPLSKQRCRNESWHTGFYNLHIDAIQLQAVALIDLIPSSLVATRRAYYSILLWWRLTNYLRNGSGVSGPRRGAKTVYSLAARIYSSLKLPRSHLAW